jgi:hypothetical protein
MRKGVELAFLEMNCCGGSLVLPVLATLLKIGDANGAELALLGSPAVFR